MIKIKSESVPMNNAMFMLLFLLIGIVSLSVFTNAQASSGDSVAGVTQMGICVVDAESPCNGVR